MKMINIFALLLISALSSVAHAETVSGTDLNVHLESANIVGTGLTVDMHRVPVVSNSTGATAYYDVSYKLTTDSKGNLTFANFTQTSSSTLNSAENFIPGTYVDQSGNKYRVSGGGIINNRTTWNMTSLTTGIILTANWATGAASGNPIIDPDGTRSSLTKLLLGQSYGYISISGSYPKGLCCGTDITAIQSGLTIVINQYYIGFSTSPYGTLTLTPSL